MLIEQGMIFALGFLCALLAVLLFLPAFWNRAIRLSMRKLAERLPLSMAEVAAERDGLRAESAIAQRRLEQARERAMEARDVERGTVGRLTASIATHEMENEVLLLDATERDHVLIETKKALIAAEAELGTVHKDYYDAGHELNRAARTAEALRVEQQRLRDVADQRRVTIGTLEMRLAGMQGRIDDLEAAQRDSAPAFAAFASSGGDAAKVAELEDRIRRLEADKGALERQLAARADEAGEHRGDAEERDELAILRRSISEVAAEVVRLGGLRETGSDAPNVLQIRRNLSRDPKGPAGDAVQGKSVGAS